MGPSWCVTSVILFLAELSLVTKSGTFMIIVNNLVNGLIMRSPQTLSKTKVASAKYYSNSLVVCNWCYPLQFFENKLEHYCNQFANMQASLQNKETCLVNRFGIQYFTTSSIFSIPFAYWLLFFKHLNIFLNGKTFRSKDEMESAFKDFVAWQPITFYQRRINNLKDRWERCIGVHGLYFD